MNYYYMYSGHSPGYFVIKNENVQVKLKYSFVLHTGIAVSHLIWTYTHGLFQEAVMISCQGQLSLPFYFRIITSNLKMSGMPCIFISY